jgi:hypothetical protein
MDKTKQQLLANTFMVGIDPAKKKHQAVARKLLLLIYTLWKTNSPYIPDYQPAAHPVTAGAV